MYSKARICYTSRKRSREGDSRSTLYWHSNQLKTANMIPTENAAA